jgi:hypothetical protein
MTIRERVLEAMLAVVDADDLDEEAYRCAWERFRGAARAWLDATRGTRARRAVTADRARGARLERVTIRLPPAVRERVLDNVPGARATLERWADERGPCSVSRIGAGPLPFRLAAAVRETSCGPAVK